MEARRTIYKGIRMRSRLEARVASWLDEHGQRWQYEGDCFADETGQYLPDFVLRDVLVSAPTLGQRLPHLYIEVKPTSVDDIPAVLRRMEIILATDSGACLALITPHDEGFWSFHFLRDGAWGRASWWTCGWRECGATFLGPPPATSTEYRPCSLCSQCGATPESPWTGRPW